MKVMTTSHACVLFASLILALNGCDDEIFAQAPADAAPEIARLAHQAEIDLHNQKPALAVVEYQKILSLDPNDISARSNLGLAYYLQNDFTHAVGEFKIALNRKPDLWNIAALCGLSQAKTGGNADAVLNLQLAFQHVTDPSLRFAVGKQLFTLLLEGGDLIPAAEVVGQLQQLEPKNVDVLYASHQIYSLLADKSFLAMAQLDPDSARMFQLRGDQLAQIGNMRGAIAAYRLAVERDPHLTGAHFALGEVLSVSQDASERAEAEVEYRKALADNPLDEKAECRLGDIELQRSNTQNASQHYKRALDLQPNDPDANEGIGMVLLMLDSSQEARIYLSRAVQLDPTNVAAYYHLSEASRKAGDLDAAKREMEEFLKLKAQRDKLKRSFNDLPLQIHRQANQGQEVQAPLNAAPPETTDEHNKPNP